MFPSPGIFYQATGTTEASGSLALQDSGWVSSGCLNGVGANGQDGDEEHKQSGRQKNPRGHGDPVRVITEDGGDHEIGRGPGQDVGGKDEPDELAIDHQDDSPDRGPEDTADPDLARPLPDDLKRQTDEPAAGYEDGKDRGEFHQADPIRLALVQLGQLLVQKRVLEGNMGREDSEFLFHDLDRLPERVFPDLDEDEFVVNSIHPHEGRQDRVVKGLGVEILDHPDDLPVEIPLEKLGEAPANRVGYSEHPGKSPVDDDSFLAVRGMVQGKIPAGDELEPKGREEILVSVIVSHDDGVPLRLIEISGHPTVRKVIR